MNASLVEESFSFLKDEEDLDHRTA